MFNTRRGCALQSEFCLLLPTLNEAENVVFQIGDVFAALPNIAKIIVLDDNSSDGTVETAQAAFPAEVSSGRLEVRRRVENPGLAPSLWEGIELCSQRFVGWMDCDLSMPAATFLEMLERLEKGYDICVGTRFAVNGGQKNWWRVGQDSRAEIFLSTLLNVALGGLLRLPVSDLTSGFIVAKRETLRRLGLRGRHGEYFIELMYRAHRTGAKLCEVAYVCGNRTAGKSKTFGSVSASVRNSFRYGQTVLGVLCEEITRIRAHALGK